MRCPPTERLAGLLAEELTEADRASIEEHVESCSRCQQELQQLTRVPNELAMEPRVQSRDSALDGAFLDRLKRYTPWAAEQTEAARTTDDDARTARLNISGYDLLEEIGRGGMGVVYKARDLKLNRLVALKMLPSARFATPDSRKRFRREALAIARLRHPNIVQVYDVGDTPDGPYFSLELIEGGNLARQLNGAPWPARSAAEIAERLAWAIHQANQQGVVHRDLKPANVLMERANINGTDTLVPKITDFGLAKCLDDDSGQTPHGAVMGTPSYLAPEQAGAMPEQVSAATDVYGLGAILYEMLTGWPPFKGESVAATLLQVAHQEPRSPTSLGVRVPRDLETICLKCLEKSPANRYASAGLLAEDLHRFLAGEPIRARPIGSVGRLARWAKRNPAIAALLLCVFLILIVAIVGISAKWLDAERARAHAVHETGLKDDALVLAERETRLKESALQDAHDEASLKEKAKRLAEAETASKDQALQKAQTEKYLSDIALAYREWQANNLKRTDQLLDACPLERRGWEWHYLKRLTHGELLSVPDTSGGDTLAFSPDGRVLALGEGSLVKTWDTTSGEAIQTITPTDAKKVRKIAFDAKGAWLAVIYQHMQDRLYLGRYDPANGHEIDTRALPEKIAGETISLDGRKLAWRTSKGLEVFDIVTGQTVPMKGESAQANRVVFSPNGEWLAAVIVDDVPVWNAKTGELVRSLTDEAPGPKCATFSANSRSIFISTGEPVWKMWDFQAGRDVQSFPADTIATAQMQATADGKYVVMVNETRGMALLDINSRRQVGVLHEPSGLVFGFALSSDGKRLATRNLDRTAKIWPMPWRGESTVQSMVGVGNSRAYFCAGGQRYLAINNAKSARVFETAGNKQFAVLDLPADSLPIAAAFNGNGRDVAFLYPTKLWLCDVETKESRTIDLDAVQTLNAMPEFTWRRHLVFSPDHKHLACLYSEREVHIRDTASGALKTRLIGHDKGIAAYIFFDEGRRMATSSLDGTIRLWNALTGEELCRLPTEKYAHHLAISPDGRLLAAGLGREHMVDVWNLETKERALVLHGHNSQIQGVAFTDDSRRLISIAQDGLFIVWDVAIGRELLVLKDQNHIFFDLEALPGGERFLTTTFDGVREIWDGSPLPGPR